MSPSEDGPPQWCVDVIDVFQGRGARSPGMIAALAHRLAASGVVLDPDLGATDVASTGGPASLTTFLPPLILASIGVRVPKIGVPGRPAGVIDTFGVLPNYKTALSQSEFEHSIHMSNFANTLSAGIFAPEDGVLFRARQQTGAQNLPALVIASLLSKKLAAGLRHVVFDIRVMAGGNFGASPPEAEANVQLLIETATLVGITASCVVTDGRVPSQPMIGRAEALRGVLSLIERRASPWLERHFQACLALAALAEQRLGGEQPDREKLRTTLDLHLQAQGAEGFAAAEEYVAHVERTHPSALLHARSAGIVAWDTDRLRAAVIDHQAEEAPRTTPERFPDACGVELLRETGDPVQAGSPLARVRAKSLGTLKMVLQRVELAATVDRYGAGVSEGSRI